MPRLPKQKLPERYATVLLALAFSFLLMGAGDSDHARMVNLGHRLMCACGDCNYMLMECNHVGCPDNDHMRAELAALISHGDSDDDILKAFSARYGAVVLAAPSRQGFNLLAWTMPFAALAMGLAGVVLYLRRWREPGGEASAQGQVANSRPSVGSRTAFEPENDAAMRRRAREETEL